MNFVLSKMSIYFVPLLLFGIVAATFLWWLDHDGDSGDVASVLIDDPVPDFSLPPVEGAGVPGFSSADLRAGEVVLVNVFASWCFPCRTEHPFLMRIAEDQVADIYGINYRDKRSNAVNWLAEWGNPYVAVGADESGRVTADWGAHGIPKTLVIDRAGVIRYRHVGPLSSEILEETVLPLVRLLREE